VSARYIVGDVLDVLRAMPDASVDLVLSSPPFLALRSYLPSDHPDKAKEIGSEPTPGAFIDTLLDVVEECRRVLAPHGSLCFELGDTYCGARGYGTEGTNPLYGERADERWREARVAKRFKKANDGWPLDKSLCLIPELLRVALVYGVNPLTGRATPRWRARNVVRWCRPNPPVGALGDKVRPATSDIIVACVDRKRFFDLDAVRGPGSANTHARTAKGVDSRPSSGKSADDEHRGGNFSTLATIHDTNGAPPLDHWWHDEETFEQDAWHIPTEPYKGSHYATWPTDLLVRPILAMCPQRVCTTCGKPSERITAAAQYVNDKTGEAVEKASWHNGELNRQGAIGRDNGAQSVAPTLGWTDCGHGTWRKGIVLDPFGGSGTTAVVALGHGRDAVLIDLDERNADLARERVGMWLGVEHHIATETVA
jgi:DNA modification methylase